MLLNKNEELEEPDERGFTKGEKVKILNSRQLLKIYKDEEVATFENYFGNTGNCMIIMNNGDWQMISLLNIDHVD